MLKRIGCLFMAITFIFPVLVFAADESYQEEAVYGAPGFNPHRDYFNQAANEHVDPYSGNVLLTYTDIYLPGDGGLDLKLQRKSRARQMMHCSIEVDKVLGPVKAALSRRKPA